MSQSNPIANSPLRSADKQPTSIFQRTIQAVMCGGLTGCMTMAVVYPTEYIKTQLQLKNSSGVLMYSGPIECCKSTFRTQGLRGFYVGFPTLFVGNFPIVAARFGTNEFLKAQLTDDSGKLSKPMSLVCGLGAGVMEALVAVVPVETIKVAYIADKKLPQPKYTSLPHAIRTILKEEGLRGVYKGVSATVLKQGSNQMVRFLVSDWLRDLYRDGDKSVAIPKPVTALIGAVAGACSVYGNTPVDVVKTRMQSGGGAYKSTLDCAKQILKNEGFLAFYKGTVPRLSRVCLDVSLSFVLFETISDIVKKFLTSE